MLDEPTSGLDPLVQQEFPSCVGEATRRGARVFLSSHVLSEVQRLADRVALIREGRLVLVDDGRDAARPRRARVEVTFAQPPPPARSRAAGGARARAAAATWCARGRRARSTRS